MSGLRPVISLIATSAPPMYLGKYASEKTSIFFDAAAASLRKITCSSDILFPCNLPHVLFEVVLHVPPQQFRLRRINPRSDAVARPLRQHRYFLREHFRDFKNAVFTFAPEPEVVALPSFSAREQPLYDIVDVRKIALLGTR